MEEMMEHRLHLSGGYKHISPYPIGKAYEA